MSTYLTFSGCLSLLDVLPETIYRVCDLIVVVADRNGDGWRDDTLAALVKDVRYLQNERNLMLIYTFLICLIIQFILMSINVNLIDVLN